MLCPSIVPGYSLSTSSGAVCHSCVLFLFSECFHCLLVRGHHVNDSVVVLSMLLIVCKSRRQASITHVITNVSCGMACRQQRPPVTASQLAAPARPPQGLDAAVVQGFPTYEFSGSHDHWPPYRAFGRPGDRDMDTPRAQRYGLFLNHFPSITSHV
jgi:hypothetical protein